MIRRGFQVFSAYNNSVNNLIKVSFCKDTERIAYVTMRFFCFFMFLATFGLACWLKQRKGAWPRYLLGYVYYIDPGWCFKNVANNISDWKEL